MVRSNSASVQFVKQGLQLQRPIQIDPAYEDPGAGAWGTLWMGPGEGWLMGLHGPLHQTSKAGPSRQLEFEV